MRSQVLYWAAQGLRGITIVLARVVVPPIASDAYLPIFSKYLSFP